MSPSKSGNSHSIYVGQNLNRRKCAGDWACGTSTCRSPDGPTETGCPTLLRRCNPATFSLSTRPPCPGDSGPLEASWWAGCPGGASRQCPRLQSGRKCWPSPHGTPASPHLSTEGDCAGTDGKSWSRSSDSPRDIGPDSQNRGRENRCLTTVTPEFCAPTGINRRRLAPLFPRRRFFASHNAGSDCRT